MVINYLGAHFDPITKVQLWSNWELDLSSFHVLGTEIVTLYFLKLFMELNRGIRNNCLVNVYDSINMIVSEEGFQVISSLLGQMLTFVRTFIIIYKEIAQT